MPSADYPTIKTETSNMLHRPIGIGVQGLADVFINMEIGFDSPLAKQLNKEIFAVIYYASLKRSNELAKIHGPYETYKGSPMSEGKFQFDLWGIDPIKNVQGLTLDWDSLRSSVLEHGVYNSLLLAPMPTASTSQIMGNNECFEPYTSFLYTRSTLAGQFEVVNHKLLKDLIDLNLWNKEMKNKIFELYKPRSLEEFLEFSKTNPKETFVYVIQQPAPNINILSASDFGYLVICLPNRDQAILSTAPYVQKMQKNLQDFRKEDYLLAVGDPVIIGISTAAVCDNTNGQFNMLKWDRREYRYYPLEVDMYQKG